MTIRCNHQSLMIAVLLNDLVPLGVNGGAIAEGLVF
jgi:hypothetical protein